MNSYLNRINSYCEINSPASCTPLLLVYRSKNPAQQQQDPAQSWQELKYMSQQELKYTSCMSNHTMNSVQYGFILLISMHVLIVYNTS